MVTINCISDTHGILPQYIKRADILIMAGDICHNQGVYSQSNWFNFTFLDWIKKQSKKFKHIIMIWGNHDYLGENEWLINWIDFPKNFHVLRNSSIEIENLKIWGSPYCLPYGNWPFMLPEEKLKLIYDMIPEGTDIIVSHGPPYGHCDKAARKFGVFDEEYERVGSKELLKVIERIKPRLVCVGHVHESYSSSQLSEKTLIVNASHMNIHYSPQNLPIEVFLS